MYRSQGDAGAWSIVRIFFELTSIQTNFDQPYKSKLMLFTKEASFQNHVPCRCPDPPTPTPPIPKDTDTYCVGGQMLGLCRSS